VAVVPPIPVRHVAADMLGGERRFLHAAVDRVAERRQGLRAQAPARVPSRARAEASFCAPERAPGEQPLAIACCCGCASSFS